MEQFSPVHRRALTVSDVPGLGLYAYSRQCTVGDGVPDIPILFTHPRVAKDGDPYGFREEVNVGAIHELPVQGISACGTVGSILRICRLRVLKTTLPEFSFKKILPSHCGSVTPRF